VRGRARGAVGAAEDAAPAASALAAEPATARRAGPSGRPESPASRPVDTAARDAIGAATIPRGRGTSNDSHGSAAIGGMTSRIMTSTHARCATAGWRPVRAIAHASAASGRASSVLPRAYASIVSVMDASRRGARASAAARHGSAASGR
jgi:hypothetical protein